MTAVLISVEETQRHRHTGEHHVTTEPEIGAMQLQAEECHGWMVTIRSSEESRKIPHRVSEGALSY